MTVVWILVAVIVAAFAFVGFCCVRMAGLTAAEDRAAQNVGIQGQHE